MKLTIAEAKKEAEDPHKNIELSIPKLMLLGILYTLSSAQQRAECLYELLQPDYEEQIRVNDEDFQKYFPLLATLTFTYIIKNYNLAVPLINRFNPESLEGYVDESEQNSEVKTSARPVN